MNDLLDITFTKDHALSEEVRAEVTSILFGLIASYIDSKGYILEAHWNSEGTNFNSIHILFDHILDNVNSFIDPLGERIRAFGCKAKANLSYAQANTLLIDVDNITNNIEDNINTILYILRTFSKLLYNYIARLDVIDKVTSNVLQDQCFKIDQLIYLLQSNTVSI